MVIMRIPIRATAQPWAENHLGPERSGQPPGLESCQIATAFDVRGIFQDPADVTLVYQHRLPSVAKTVAAWDHHSRGVGAAVEPYAVSSSRDVFESPGGVATVLPVDRPLIPFDVRVQDSSSRPDSDTRDACGFGCPSHGEWTFAAAGVSREDVGQSPKFRVFGVGSFLPCLTNVWSPLAPIIRSDGGSIRHGFNRLKKPMVPPCHACMPTTCPSAFGIRKTEASIS